MHGAFGPADLIVGGARRTGESRKSWLEGWIGPCRPRVVDVTASEPSGRGVAVEQLRRDDVEG